MQPIILITVFRRYHELVKSIEHIHNVRAEFKKPPIIVVVWAAPEVQRMFLFESLIKLGFIQHVLYRDQDPSDGLGKPTTAPESLNLRLGLEFIDKNYKNYYVVGQACDITTKPQIYRWIDAEIEKYEAVLFFWNNGISLENVWHTNFFVTRSRNYWPPLAKEGDADTLERIWGRYLSENKLNNFSRSHNSRGLKFNHDHISELMEEFPKETKKVKFTINCEVIVKKDIKYYYRRFVRWLKYKLNMTQ